MKKTILLALLSASSLALASGKVELTEVLENGKFHSMESGFNFKNDLKSTHKLDFVVSEDKFAVSGELKSKGDHNKELKEAFSFDGGNVKLAYNHNNIDASFKLEFPSKSYEIYGAYTHKKGDFLSGKPAVTFRREKEAFSIKGATDLLYKDNKYSLENNTVISGGVNKFGEFVFPQLIEDNKVKGLHTTFVVSNDLKATHKPNEEVKLTAMGSYKYSVETLRRGLMTIPTEKDSQANTLHIAKATRQKEGINEGKKYENTTTFNFIQAAKILTNKSLMFKVEYDSKTLEGLKADASLKLEKRSENLDSLGVVDEYKRDEEVVKKDQFKSPINDEENIKKIYNNYILNVKTNTEAVDLNANVSYKFELGKGFSITPAISAEYGYMKNKYTGLGLANRDINGKIKSVRQPVLSRNANDLRSEQFIYTQRNWGVTPKLSAGYKVDKFEAMLGLELPITGLSKISRYDQKHVDGLKKESFYKTQLFNYYYKKDKNSEKLSYNKTSAKVTLNLKYSW